MERSLSEFIEAHNGGLSATETCMQLGGDARLIDRIDNRQESIQYEFATTLAKHLGQSIGSVLFASGGVAVTAPRPGARRPAIYIPARIPDPGPRYS